MPAAAQSSVLLAMSAPPYWHCGRTVRRQSLMTLAALLPAVIGAVWTWGLPAVRVMSLCVAVAVLTEAACQKLMGRELAIDDYTAVCSGLLLSFMLPADAPWWIAVMAPLIAISLGKMAFGGLGANPVNTSVVGWAVLFVSFPLFMEPNAVQLNAALLAIHDEEGEDVDAFRCAVVRGAERTYGAAWVLFACTLPLLLAFHPVTVNGFTLSRTGVGISLDFWQAALVLLTALVTGVLAVRLVERRLVKKRFLPPEEKTEAQRKNNRLLRTTALALCAALALSAFINRALVGFGDTRRLAEGTEFTDFDSFVRYMRKPVEPTYYGDAAPAPDTAVAESPLYYENDTPIYRSQTEGATIEDDNGNVLCYFIWRNRSVVFWRTGPKADGYLPVTVYTQEAMSLAQQKAKHINMVFYGVYAVEVVAAAAYYLRKREK